MSFVTTQLAVGHDYVFNADYGWEGPGAVLGMKTWSNDNLAVSLSSDWVYNGAQSLMMEETPLEGTPQAYVAFIENLEEGDIITASFYVFDTIPGGSSNGFVSGRIWAHYANSGDIDSYEGSAGGNYTYSQGIGWEQISHEWIFEAETPVSRDALVIEARIYSAEGSSTLWLDELSVEVQSDNPDIVITTPRDVFPDCLYLETDAQAGEESLFTVIGGEPGKAVVVLADFDMGYFVFDDGDWCVDFGLDIPSPTVAQQQVVIQGILDGSGSLSQTQFIPPHLSGQYIYFQAAQRGTCPETCMSNVVSIDL